MIRYGSVCSGIEAASVAWHPLGWRASFLSEIEAFPRAVLAHHYPDTPLHGDFTTIAAGQYDPIDLLVGGTPCQSFSIAGLRGGLDDDRGNLALEYLRLADRLRPRWLVWENVPGVLSSSGGRDFGAILGGMVELGYGFAYRVLDAQFFGVAQRRRRVFVVGYLGDWRRAAAVLFERHSLSGHPAPRRKARKDVAGDARTRAASGDELLGGWDYESNAHEASEPTGPLLKGSPTGGGYPLPAVAFAIQERAVCENPDAGPDGAGFRTDDAAYTLEARTVPQAVAFALRGRDGGAMPEACDDGSVGTLRSADGGSSRDYVAFDTTQITSAANYSNPRPGDPCHPLASGAHPPAIAGSAVRRLTPRECERLQGFPDDWTLIPTWAKGAPKADAEETARWILQGDAAWRFGTPEEKSAAWERGLKMARHPDGPRYKALGNSMAVPVMAWIGRRIAAVEALIIQSERTAA